MKVEIHMSDGSTYAATEVTQADIDGMKKAMLPGSGTLNFPYAILNIVHIVRIDISD